VSKRIQIEAALLFYDFAEFGFAEFPLVNHVVKGMMKKRVGYFSFIEERFTKF
jgi:hypothetical protein